MRPNSAPHIFLAALLAVTSSAFDLGGENDVTQTAATVAPDQAIDSLNPNSWVNGFRIPTTGGQGWLQPTGESTSTGNQGLPLHNPFSEGGQGLSLQLGWPSSTGENHELGALGVDESGSCDGELTPPSGGQAWASGHGWAPLGGAESWTPPNGGQGGWAPPSGSQGWPAFSGDQGWGMPGIASNGLSEGQWTPPTSNQEWGSLGLFECSGSDDGEQSPETIYSAGRLHAAGGSQEKIWPSTAESAPAALTASNGFGAQSWSQPSSTDALSSTETLESSSNADDQESKLLSSMDTPSMSATSQTATNTEDLGWSPAAQTSTEDTSLSTTPTDSSVSVENETMYKSGSATSSGSEAVQQQQQEYQSQQGRSLSKTAEKDVTASMSVWGAPVVAETGTNHSSAVPSFGKIISKTGGCVVGEPAEYISTEDLDWVWDNRIGPKADVSNEANWNVMANKNWIMDHLVHNKGSMNYCVRWDTDNILSKDVASKFKGVLERHFNAWNKWLEGYNCWPFTEININMVGFAAKAASQFQWTDDSLGRIYEGHSDSDGVPQCPDECYRFHDNVNNVWSDTSACQGEPFDVSFWLKEDIPYGFGYDWGQEVSLNDTMQNLYDENIMFIGHEIGHGFGLPDFYEIETKPSKDFPSSIMMAYSSTTITPSDGWMLRRVLDHVRDRYKF